MTHWESIRSVRDDLTDYVMHLTRHRLEPEVKRPLDVLLEILQDGHIRPTFAPMRSRYRRDLRPTIKGPDPAVCLTEQPLSAFVNAKSVVGARYSGYGIAYHKVHLHLKWGRPVWYCTERELGRRVRPGEPGWEEGKDIFTGGIPPQVQYLWALYEPEEAGSSQYPVDFTWQREWRIKTQGTGFPVLLADCDHHDPARGSILVEKDQDVPVIRSCLDSLVREGRLWAQRLRRVISLETVRRKLQEGDGRYGRLDTWPET